MDAVFSRPAAAPILCRGGPEPVRSAVSRSAGAAESRRLSRAPDYPFSLPETGRKNHPLKDDFSYRQTKFSRAKSENAQSDDSKLCVLPDTLAQLSAPAARAAEADSAVSYDRRGRDIHYNIRSGSCAARKLPAARMKNAAPFGAARRELPFHSLPPEEADGKAGADGGRIPPRRRLHPRPDGRVPLPGARRARHWPKIEEICRNAREHGGGAARPLPFCPRHVCRGFRFAALPALQQRQTNRAGRSMGGPSAGADGKRAAPRKRTSHPGGAALR